MNMTSKIRTTSKKDEGLWIEFQNNVPNPWYLYKLQMALIGTIPGWVMSGRLGWGWSNSDFKAISASQQSWSIGLAELGKNPLGFDTIDFVSNSVFVRYSFQLELAKDAISYALCMSFCSSQSLHSFHKRTPHYEY